MGTAHLLKSRRLILGHYADPLDFLLDKRSGRDDLFAGPRRCTFVCLAAFSVSPIALPPASESRLPSVPFLDRFTARENAHHTW